MIWPKVLMYSILPAFLLLDLARTARPGDGLRSWRVRAALVSVATFGLALAVGLAYKAWLGGFRLLPGDQLGLVGGIVVGALSYDLLHYAYHRMAHRRTWLWRMGHQMHHSAETVDAWGAYFLHPLDALAFLVISHTLLVPVLGLDPLAAAWAATIIRFCVVFQHARLRTPHWLGWFIQRPESHAIHHERGVHAWNYANFPVWDMILGTYRNPREVVATAHGFYDGASRRIIDMLAFRDVSEKKRMPAAGVRSP